MAPQAALGGICDLMAKKSSASGSAQRKASGRQNAGVVEFPKPPFPEQTQETPGLESKMTPRPRYRAPNYRPAGKLAGKVALITGGDSGIGRSVALLYAREGADLALVYLPAEQSDADEIAHEVQAVGQSAMLIPGDVSDPKFCEEAVERTVQELGQIDILVNNAAYQQHHATIEELSYEQWDRTFKTNIYGYFAMAKAAVPHLAAGGCIINTGSITGMQGSKQLLDYSATKGAIHAFTKSLAQNLVERGIRVNCVAPGPVWTPLQPQDKSAKAVAEHGADVPMERPAQPEEIAPSYVFLASNADSGYITGEIITLLGGETTAA